MIETNVQLNFHMESTVCWRLVSLTLILMFLIAFSKLLSADIKLTSTFSLFTIHNLSLDVDQQHSVIPTRDEIMSFPLKYTKLYNQTNASYVPETGCYMLFHPTAKACKLLHRPRRNAGPYRPDFFILGTRKGGTTSLVTYISKHRYVSSIHISGRPQDGEVFTSMQAIRAYNARFRAAGKLLVGDSNVQRLIESQYLIQNKDSSRFLVLLRDPIERCYSQCLMRIRSKPKTFHNLDIDLNGQLDAQRKILLQELNVYSNILNMTKPPKLFRTAKNCWYEGMYYIHLKRLLTVLPENTIRIYWSQDFFRRTEAVVTDALKFIGADPADWDPGVVDSKYNTHKKHDFERHKLSPELVAKMRDVYRPFDQALGELVGSPVPWLQER